MNRDKSILVVDDDERSRMTMVHALETSGFHVESAISAAEALLMLEASPFDLVFLDPKMLPRTKQSWPAMRVVVITGHGRGDDAVEAIKLGASDFIRKPFTPEEIRELTESLLLPLPEDARAAGYECCLAEARRSIAENHYASAIALVRQAAGLDPTRPEAFNLLGAAVHQSGQQYRAQDYFRAAIALDPTYQPAYENLERSGGAGGLEMALSLGADDEGA